LLFFSWLQQFLFAPLPGFLSSLVSKNFINIMSCEACGWMAALVSALAFGSFGVPIKSKASRSVDIDPLVFQSYKTFMCFVTSWFILFHEEFEFTPWGIVSGLFWVPGGVATVYAIKSAGLAIGIGIGSSFIVLVSFVWGIFVFGEAVHSKVGACFAIFCMMAGLMGMSYFSSPTASDEHQPEEEDVSLTANEEDAAAEAQLECTPALDGNKTVLKRFRGRASQYKGVGTEEEEDEEEQQHGLDLDSSLKATDRTELSSCTESFSDDNETSTSTTQLSSARDDTTILLFGNIPLTKRHRGMLAAMFCGVWGGSIMAPMKLCKSDAQGTAYLLSFSIGASIITLALWLFRFLYNVAHYRSFSQAYGSLPSFHIRVMWLSGGSSGFLWSIGNFFSLISVLNLGEGVGYPLSQTSILISGLWGIFYFKEVTGVERISKWLCSSLLTIFGILLLSYEHHEK
jgi:glucose uptake protein GlcU